MRLLLTLALFCFFCNVRVNAQGPTLKLVGTSPTFAKGTINTEVLTAIIQQKQEEVKQKVFRNLIVKQFNNYTYAERLKNFTTYYYIYNLMDVITSGKNKTVITKAITEHTSEFAFVYGLALFIKKSAEKENAEKTFGGIKIDASMIENAKVTYGSTSIEISDKVKEFNILLDLCLEVILNDPEIQTVFKFKRNLNDKEFSVWYESDNVFQKEYADGDAGRKAQLEELKQFVQTKLQELKKSYGGLSKLIVELNGMLVSENMSLQKGANIILSSFSTLTKKEIEASLNNLKLVTGISDENKKKIEESISFIGANYDEFKHLLAFYEGLKKSDFKDFTLTKDQYYAMKYIILNFLSLAKNQFENDVVASVIDFLLENTLVEYTDADGNQKLEAKSTNLDKGYLYVDIESIVAAFDQKFSSTNKKGIGVYVLPFFSIGTNIASFNRDNSLNSGNSLNNLYYASEKIGIKWKIWNWKYTRSFPPGENYRYYNKKESYRYWLRPQQKPTISDVHVIVYGSGLLYNIANLKSDESFNYGVVGCGLGLTFFNGLSTSFGIASPFTNKQFKKENSFLNFGLDIPIVEYIAGLRNKSK